MRKYLIILCVILMYTVAVTAQKMSVGFIYPAGGEKGTTVTIEIGGLNLKSASDVLISGDGIVKATIVALEAKKDNTRKKGSKIKLNDQSSPQLEDRIGVQVSIDKSATPGIRDLRLKSTNGISNKLPFEVGQYPNLLETKESSASQPNLVKKLPATLCGQIMAAEIDYYSFEAKKGTQLVAAAKGRALVPFIADAVPGWFQPVMRIVNDKGTEIGFCDDYRNNVDPVIITTIPETGRYTLSIHDAIFRGREDFNYRIELGEIPFVEYSYPCVGVIGKKTTLNLVGVNLKQNSIIYKPSRVGRNLVTTSGISNYTTNPLSFWVVERSCHLTTAPKVNAMLDNGTVLFDSLRHPNEIKSYPVYALKNENIVIDVKARRLGSMMDPKIRLKDASGNILVEVDDVEDAMEGLMTHHADPVLQYKSKAEEMYTIEIFDISGDYGPDFYYMIERKENIPTFEVFVTPANLTIPKGGTGVFHLDIISQVKSSPALDFSIKGLPKGYKLSSTMLHAGSKSWDISITAPENSKENQLSMEIIATAQLKGKDAGTISQTAVAADNMLQAFYYTHHIAAAGFTAELSDPPPFTLNLASSIERHPEQSIPLHLNDTVIPIQLRINRKEGFTEPVEISLNKKIKQLTLDAVSFLAGETEKTIYLKLNKDAAKQQRRFRAPFYFVGTVKGEIEKVGKRTFQNALYREISPVFVLEMQQK